jgi:hypothetical protein
MITPWGEAGNIRDDHWNNGGQGCAVRSARHDTSTEQDTANFTVPTLIWCSAQHENYSGIGDWRRVAALRSARGGFVVLLF